MTRHLLSSADLSRRDVETILDTAASMHDVQRREVKKLPTLRGRTIINFFFEDSTRTRSSFEIAGKWMSADTINLSAKGSSTSKGESLRDSVQTINAMAVDALVIRHNQSGACRQVAGWVDASVINAGDGTHEHPTQALLDAYTLRSRIGALDGKHVAIVGDLTHSRVFRSNVITLRTLGARVTVVAPPTLMPAGIAAWSQRDGFETSWDLDAVLADARAQLVRGVDEADARACVERLALLLQAAILLRAGHPLARAYCRSRLGAGRGTTYGTLASSIDGDAAIARIFAD